MAVNNSFDSLSTPFLCGYCLNVYDGNEIENMMMLSADL